MSEKAVAKKHSKVVWKKILRKVEPFTIGVLILAVWQILCSAKIVPSYMLPSPAGVVKAFVKDFPLLMSHTKITLAEAFIGLAISMAISFFFAVIMDKVGFLRRSIYPVLVVTQTIPTIAIAPLLVLWLGYKMLPKIALVVITCFFPLTVNMLNGFASVDKDAIKLLKSFGASRWQIFFYAKLPFSVSYILSGLKLSVSYSIISAVVSEWLGGTVGLGVYMTRVKKSYAFDKMFAVIFLVSALSLILMKIISIIEKRLLRYEKKHIE